MSSYEPVEKMSSDGAPFVPFMRRVVLYSYRMTSSELRRRSTDEVLEDPVLELPMRLGVIALWCYCLALVGIIAALLIISFPTTQSIFPGRQLLLAAAVIPRRIMYLTVGALTFASVASWIIGRIILGASLEARKTYASESIAKNVAYRDVEQVRASRGSHERELFRRNLHDTFVLRSFRWSEIRVFEDGVYPFAPRVNVILGKNGYGKTLLLRALAAILQREVDYSKDLFQSREKPRNSDKGRLVAEVTRNRGLETIIRDPLYFEDTVGKIPLLAIPDSRFVNRSTRSVSSSSTGTTSLAESGAWNYLTQEPYEDVVVELLVQMGIEHVQRKRGGFKRPIFQLIQDVVRALTDDEFFSFARIVQSGRTGFEIYVNTAGSPDVPIPIQSASQGTFSVIAIFGLIYSFLKSINPEESTVLQTPAIVIIDEVEAHLHPSWQQKILSLLTSKFPNVQFIISAHSPLIVAGCDRGEVAVLRRNSKTNRFRVEVLQHDFLGATAGELYDEIFEIEDADRLYLQYAAKADMPDAARVRELAALHAKEKLSEAEERRIAELEHERRLIEKATQKREERIQREHLSSTISDLEDQVGRLQRELKRLRAEQSPVSLEDVQ